MIPLWLQAGFWGLVSGSALIEKGYYALSYPVITYFSENLGYAITQK